MEISRDDLGNSFSKAGAYEEVRKQSLTLLQLAENPNLENEDYVSITNVVEDVKAITDPYNSWWMVCSFFIFTVSVAISSMIVKIDKDKQYFGKHYSNAAWLGVMNLTNTIGYSIAAIYQKNNPFRRWESRGIMKLFVAGVIKAIASMIKILVFVKLPVETNVAFSYTIIIWLAIFAVVKEKRAVEWVNTMPILAITVGIISYIASAFQNSANIASEQILWFVLGLFVPLFDAINSYLVANIFNTDFADWNQTERGFAFVSIQMINCFATMPLEALLKYLTTDANAFDIMNFTPFADWSWLTPFTIATYGLGCISMVKLSENAVLKTIASYASSLLQMVVSYSIFKQDKFNFSSFSLVCTLLLLSVNYRIAYSHFKQKMDLMKLNEKLQALLPDNYNKAFSSFEI